MEYTRSQYEEDLASAKAKYDAFREEARKHGVEDTVPPFEPLPFDGRRNPYRDFRDPLTQLSQQPPFTPASNNYFPDPYHNTFPYPDLLSGEVDDVTLATRLCYANEVEVRD